MLVFTRQTGTCTMPSSYVISRELLTCTTVGASFIKVINTSIRYKRPLFTPAFWCPSVSTQLPNEDNQPSLHKKWTEKINEGRKEQKDILEDLNVKLGHKKWHETMHYFPYMFMGYIWYVPHGRKKKIGHWTM